MDPWRNIQYAQERREGKKPPRDRGRDYENRDRDYENQDRDYGNGTRDYGNGDRNYGNGGDGPPGTGSRDREPRRASDRYGPPPGLLPQPTAPAFFRVRPQPPPPPTPPPPPPPVERYRPPPEQYDGWRSRHQARPRDEARPPQGDFSFRMDKPARVGESTDSPRSQRGWGGHRGRPPTSFRRKLAAERPMLSLAQAAPATEVMFGVDDTRSKFRALEDLSDSEEAEMDMSDDGKANDDGPSAKKARLGKAEEPADNVPKWSNPDPYSVLPPTAEDKGRKKVSVVDIIRKARIDSGEKKAAVAEAEEFISFDLDDDVKTEVRKEARKGGKIKETQPKETKPKETETKETETKDTETKEVTTKEVEEAETKTSTPQADTKEPASNQAAAKKDKQRSRSNSRTRERNRTASRDSGPLGNRKRTHDDELKPPSYTKLKGKALREATHGFITKEWAPRPDEVDCPWILREHANTSDVNVWLHKEIVEFYEHVRPRAFERKVRGELVARLARNLGKDKIFRDATVQAFGSYASDLYLPTADMDLVVCSRKFADGGPAKFGSNSWLYKFRGLLTRTNLAQAGSIELILHAKVPLVKYIDRQSGLRVDVSFENLTGVVAIETFMAWKALYPAMPILVTLIKHFLGMRGLSEPVNGGIGGFSVVCLVVSMFQLMPQVQSRSLVPEHHLGEMLMEFFRLYGTTLNYTDVAIRLDPAGYVNKADVTHVVYKGNNQRKLSIIDPNNPANDISAGSSNFPTIQQAFEDAYRQLHKALRDNGVTGPADGPRSILRSILAGNYSTFRRQRNYLRKLHEDNCGPCED